MKEQLSLAKKLYVKQVFELGEVFGFETRNKYRVQDEHGRPIGFIAEQQKGLLGLILRQFLGHWRRFDIHFFDQNKTSLWIARHPFRWYFARLELSEASGKCIGAIERRFAFFSKRFVIEDANGTVILSVNSPFWKIWTFPFVSERGPVYGEVARVSKKWSGVGYEIFTDRDNFLVEFLDETLSEETRSLVLAASVYIDLMFFEKKAETSST